MLSIKEANLNFEAPCVLEKHPKKDTEDPEPTIRSRATFDWNDESVQNLGSSSCSIENDTSGNCDRVPRLSRPKRRRRAARRGANDGGSKIDSNDTRGAFLLLAHGQPKIAIDKAFAFTRSANEPSSGHDIKEPQRDPKEGKIKKVKNLRQAIVSQMSQNTIISSVYGDFEINLEDEEWISVLPSQGRHKDTAADSKVLIKIEDSGAIECDWQKLNEELHMNLIVRSPDADEASVDRGLTPRKNFKRFRGNSMAVQARKRAISRHVDFDLVVNDDFIKADWVKHADGELKVCVLI